MSCELKAKEVKCFGVHEKKPMSCGFGVKALALEFGKSSSPKTGASILASEPFQCFRFISAETASDYCDSRLDRVPMAGERTEAAW